MLQVSSSHIARIAPRQGIAEICDAGWRFVGVKVLAVSSHINPLTRWHNMIDWTLSRIIFVTGGHFGCLCLCFYIFAFNILAVQND